MRRGWGAWARSFAGRHRAALLRGGYVAVILLGTLVDLRFSPDLHAAARRLARAVEPAFTARALLDGVRNVLLFAGFGAVWSLTDRGRSPSWRVVRATAVGCALSISVETLQLFSPARFSSVLDVATNTLGSALGVGAVIAVAAWARGRRDGSARTRGLVAATYLAAAALEAVTPRLRAASGALFAGSPFMRLRAAIGAMEPLTLGSIPMEEALLWAPAGFLCARALASRAERPMLVVAGLGAAAAAEVARGLVGASIVPGAVVAHVIGFAAGAALATLVAHGERRSAVGAPSAGVTAYALVIAYWAWRPFALRPNPFDALARTSVDQLLPLATQAAHSDLAGVTDVLIGFLLYAGLGALLARRPHSTPRSLLVAACVSLVTEAGQLFVAGRFFDVTDIVIQCAGAAAGWLLVRAPGARPDA